MEALSLLALARRSPDTYCARLRRSDPTTRMRNACWLWCVSGCLDPMLECFSSVAMVGCRGNRVLERVAEEWRTIPNLGSLVPLAAARRFLDKLEMTSRLGVQE